jgi:hypothetical protein
LLKKSAYYSKEGETELREMKLLLYGVEHLLQCKSGQEGLKCLDNVSADALRLVKTEALRTWTVSD